jgi:hypothetical protein
MKKILFSALMACFALTASAQISEGAPSAKKYTTGNRPLKGTFGLYIGVENELFNTLGDNFSLQFNPLPIVNLKYMATDNFELRLGMKFWKQRETLAGGNDQNDDNGVTADEKFSQKWVSADNQFRPGFAYHFTKSNLLDVYAGIEGIIGWQRNTLNTTIEIDGKKAINNTHDARIQFGAGAFIGLQAFIARLPLALGLEYGVSTVWDGAVRQKTYVKNENTDPATEYTIYNPVYTANTGDVRDLQQVAEPFASTNNKGGWDYLKARKGAWGSQVRLTLSYYFNR